jgi:hypothetical protein
MERSPGRGAPGGRSLATPRVLTASRVASTILEGGLAGAVVEVGEPAFPVAGIEEGAGEGTRRSGRAGRRLYVPSTTRQDVGRIPEVPCRRCSWPWSGRSLRRRRRRWWRGRPARGGARRRSRPTSGPGERPRVRAMGRCRRGRPTPSRLGRWWPRPPCASDRRSSGGVPFPRSRSRTGRPPTPRSRRRRTRRWRPHPRGRRRRRRRSPPRTGRTRCCGWRGCCWMPASPRRIGCGRPTRSSSGRIRGSCPSSGPRCCCPTATSASRCSAPRPAWTTWRARPSACGWPPTRGAAPGRSPGRGRAAGGPGPRGRGGGPVRHRR